jgi:hypothetical protein
MGFFDFFRRKPTPEKFAAIFMDFARKQGFTQKMHYVAEEFQIRVEGEGNHVLNLHNAWHDYCRAGRSSRQQLLIKYTASLNVPQMPQRFDDAKANLMPTVRGRGQIEYLRLMTQIEGSEHPFEDLSQAFSDDAVLMLAYDTEHSIATLMSTQLKDWGVDTAAAMTAALANLRDRTVDQFVDLGEGVVMGEWNDAYDTSRILLPDLAYRAGVGSDPVMMIPTRGCFMLTAGSNIAGQIRMIVAAHESIEHDGRFVSSAMYCIQGGKIQAYQPQDGAVVQMLGDLQHRCLASDYRSQQELLEKLHEVKKQDIFVATYQLLENKADHSLTSCCTWVKGVDSLLPKTDWVALVTPDDSGGDAAVTKMLAWADVMSIGAELMQAVEGYPLRYRVQAFPSVQQLAAVPEV